MNRKTINFSQEENRVYADAVCVEDKLLFLSGMISEDPVTGDFLPGDIVAETRQVLNNLAAMLEQLGSDMDHVVRMEVFLADFADRDGMNAEYLRHFSQAHMPARVCMGGVALADGCRIEVMATAVKK